MLDGILVGVHVGHAIGLTATSTTQHKCLTCTMLQGVGGRCIGTLGPIA